MIRTVVASLTFFLASCATAPSAPAKPFVATGAINTRVGNASFSADAVAGPEINIRNVGGNDWRGTLRDQTIDVTVRGNRVTGVNLTVQIEEQPNQLVITGQLAGSMFRFELTPDVFRVRTPTRSDDVPRVAPNAYEGVTFSGDALEGKRPEPQFALALIGTFF